MKLSKKLVALGTAGAIVIGGSIAGYAFWTTGGSGTGSADIGTDSSNIGLVATGVANLIPGGSSVGLDIATSNPNPYSVALTGKTVTIDSVECGGEPVDAAWFSVDAGEITSAVVTPPKSGDTNGAASLSPSGVTIKMNNDAANTQDACKGNAVTFTLVAA